MNYEFSGSPPGQEMKNDGLLLGVTVGASLFLLPVVQ